MPKIIIEHVESKKWGRCSERCSFRGSNDICSWCSLGCGIPGRLFGLDPGPDCPGPGEYELKSLAPQAPAFHDETVFVADQFTTEWPPDAKATEEKLPSIPANRMGAVKARISGRLVRGDLEMPWSFDFTLAPEAVAFAESAEGEAAKERAGKFLKG